MDVLFKYRAGPNDFNDYNAILRDVLVYELN
jgi:hypothetical protein